MSRLEDLEAAIVERIATTPGGGGPLMATVRGATGPLRGAMQAALLRERMPAAYVAFTEDFTALDLQYPGPRFSIFAATRALRLTSNPRFGDADTRGAFDVIEALRGRLDNFFILPDAQLLGFSVRFFAGDERLAIYELSYRVSQFYAPPLFNGQPLGGTLSRTTRRLAPPDGEPGLLLTKQPDATYEVRDAVPAAYDAPAGEILAWRGEVRAADAAGLDALLADLATLVSGGAAATLIDHAGRSYPAMRLVRALALRPSYVDPIDLRRVQEMELVFRRATA